MGGSYRSALFIFMNDNIRAELALPAVGLGIGVTTGCLCACFSDLPIKVVLMVISAVLTALCIFTGKKCLPAASLLLGLVSMTVYQTWWVGSLEALADSDIRSECRIVSVNYSDNNWSAGKALCLLDGKPTLINLTCNSEIEIGDTIDGELHLEKAEQNIFTFSDGIVLSAKVNEIHSRRSDFSLLYHLGNLRSAAAQRFDSLGGDEAELCKGLVLGIKDGFSMKLRQDILRSGVSYMTAVSGAHITIFIAVLCELFGKSSRKQTALISIAAVLLMMVMFGFSASVVRSGIMLILTQGSALFLRRTCVLNSLCTALLIMTIFTPFAAADPALLMSALGVFGAAAAGPELNRLRKFGWERLAILAKLKEAAAVSFCAMVYVLPVSLSVFGGLSLAEIPASLALTPFFSAGLPLGVLYAVSGIPTLAIPLRAVIGCFRGILGAFGEMDGAWIPCENTFAIPAAMLAPILLTVCIFIGDHARKALGAFLLDVLLILCLCSSDLSTRHRISFVSDGNSGAAVICKGRNAAVLISGYSSCAEQLFQLMTREGITHIDMINAPQLDYSELFLLDELMEAIPADTVMVPQDCLTAAKESRVAERTRLTAAEELTQINDISIACAKAGSSIRADIALYYGYTRSEPDISAELALYASSRQKALPDGALNIHGQIIRINL